MLTLAEALDRILTLIPPLPSELVPVGAAMGRYLAEGVTSEIDLPSFDNSSMDGYALRSVDTALAGANAAVMLRLIGEVPAGSMFQGAVGDGECVRIFTGSPMPQGADAVLMQEDSGREAMGIRVLAGVEAGENIRRQGEDIRAGQVLVSAGTVVGAGSVGLLASAGVVNVRAHGRPRVALLATGSELREPGEPLSPGQIYESNRAMLAALCSQSGAIATIVPIIPDDLLATRTALDQAFNEHDVVITSGGVSVGEYDFVKAAFEATGGTIEFWKVSIRPGKPFVFGHRNGKFLMGLPGNPVSAFVTFLLLVRPALLRLQGAKETGLRSVRGCLSAAIRNDGDRTHYIRIHLQVDGSVAPSGKQASHVLSSLAAANGLLEVPPGVSMQAGDPVEVLIW